MVSDGSGIRSSGASDSGIPSSGIPDSSRVAAVEFLRAAPSGTRVVARYLLPDGQATDALGYVSATSASQIVIATVRGLTTVDFAKVLAAKEVPPPPAPRPR